MEDKIKEAFERVKFDIFSLGNNIEEFKQEIIEVRQELNQILQEINKIKENQLFPTQKPEIPTFQHIKPTENQIPTHNLPLQALKSPNFNISIGNEGVPTDKQTDKPTDKKMQILTSKLSENEQFCIRNEGVDKGKTKENSKFNKIDQILASLDSIKKELRLKFKNLTKQEFLVFSTLYVLEEQQEVDYKLLANKLNLSESSVRDYIQRLISKAIPVEKTKINNKKIILKISPELKKIASLDTIIKLKELNLRHTEQL